MARARHQGRISRLVLVRAFFERKPAPDLIPGGCRFGEEKAQKKKKLRTRIQAAVALPERPTRRHIRALVGEVALKMLRRCQEDSHRWKHEACRYLGQRILIDGTEIDRSSITHFDLEQSVSAGRKSISSGQSGVDAGKYPRRVGRRQRLVVA